MLDDLRNSASDSFQDEDEDQNQAPAPRHETIRMRGNPSDQQPFLGMTAQQRFVVALLLFLMVAVVGVLALVALDKVFLPAGLLF